MFSFFSLDCITRKTAHQTIASLIFHNKSTLRKESVVFPYKNIMVQIRNKVDEKYILIDETTGSSGINIGHTLIDVLQNETSSENCHFALKQLRKITFNLTIARFSRKSVIEDLLSPTFFCSCSNQRAFLKVKN